MLYAFEDVWVSRNGVDILRGVTASVRGAGVTCILGPSGSGKTTLLRLCNRLEVPSAGTVVFNGVDVATLDPLQLRRRAGMVFQRPTLFPGSVRDNLLVARPGASEAEMLGVMERVGLGPDYLGRTADNLSGGEAQRACVARTLLAGPQVVLFDEATSSLDPAPKARLEETARHLADDGMAVLWVTHDLEQTRRLADDVLVVIDGTVAFAGSAAELDVAGERVAEFLHGR